MPKYDAIVHFSMIFTFDTNDFSTTIFAKTKDELVDKLDPNDTYVVAEWVQDVLEGDTFAFDGVPEITRVALSRVDN